MRQSPSGPLKSGVVVRPVRLIRSDPSDVVESRAGIVQALNTWAAAIDAAQGDPSPRSRRLGGLDDLRVQNAGSVSASRSRNRDRSDFQMSRTLGAEGDECIFELCTRTSVAHAVVAR